MSAQPTLPWSGPKPATDQELDAIKLTVDVAVGNTVFRAGTSLLQLVRQHRALYGQVHEGKDQLL